MLSDGVRVVFGIVMLGLILLLSLETLPRYIAMVAEERAAVTRETVSQREAALEAAHPTWSRRDREQVAAREITLGMTQEMVRASWGNPRDINRSVGSWGVHEQWVYGSYPYSQYLYFENGILTSWQD